MEVQEAALESLSDDLAVLESFVVENDDLLELEAHIGKFNIFDALRVERVEIRHSNFLAWLLDPAESHGQGSLFLKSILMDLFKTARESGFSCPVSPIQLDGEELRGVEIRREWRNIDLLIVCEQPRFVVAIENKIKSGEHSNQLDRYRNTVCTEFGEVPSMYVFLTIEGDDPSEDAREDWVPYSYGDLHRILTRLSKVYEKSIGDDVLAFLNHYLRLIKGRLMDDPAIAQLCQRIYTNHRQALDLIFQHIDTTAGLLTELQSVLEADSDQWHIFNKTGKRIDFVPREWTTWIPEICARPKWHPQMWLRWYAYCGPKNCRIVLEVGPTTDNSLRRRAIERLTASESEFGCRVTGRRTDKWTRLRSESVAKWSIDEEPEREYICEAFKSRIEKLARELGGVSDALKPIFKG